LEELNEVFEWEGGEELLDCLKASFLSLFHCSFLLFFLA